MSFLQLLVVPGDQAGGFQFVKEGEGVFGVVAGFLLVLL